MNEASELAAGIAAEFRRRVCDEYVPRIGRCVLLLDPEQLWHRQGQHGNAVANLLLHLAGNVHQWIECGIGGAPDDRDRGAEFAARPSGVDTPSGGQLMQRLRRTVARAADIVDGLTPAQLLEVRRFQSRYEVTCLAAVLHVLEHFSGHAGQIYAFTKQTLDIDLRFYDL